MMRPATVSERFNPYPYEADITHRADAITYRNNFSDPRSGWPEHPNSRYVSGGYELSNLPKNVGNVGDAMRSAALNGSIPYEVASVKSPMAFRPNVIAAYGPWWTNFRASVSLKVDPAPQTLGARSQFPYAVCPATGLIFRMNSEGYYALLPSGLVEKKKLSVEVVRRDFLPNQQQDYTETSIVPWTIAGHL